jgi:hypothetical protein
VDRDQAGGRLLEAGDQAQAGGLARTGGAQHREELAVEDVEADLVHRPDRDRRKRSQLQGKNIDLLETELEQAILDLSKEGTASKTGAGEFSVLHKQEQSVEEIESNIREVAGRYGLGKDALGFQATTVKIEAGSTPSAIREKIAFAYGSVRDDFDDFDRSATPIDMMKVLAFCVVALAIGGIVGGLLAYMP